jgi:NAD(P)-dependent dehydrogenase (short-subunit alcohol dehydrogenase family)
MLEDRALLVVDEPLGGHPAEPLKAADQMAALFEATGPLDLLLYGAGAVARSPPRAPRHRLEEVLVANFLGASFALEHARFNPGAKAILLGSSTYVEVPASPPIPRASGLWKGC